MSAPLRAPVTGSRDARLCVLLLVMLGLTLLAGPARAAGPSRVFLDYHHTAWSLQQGAPADIWALAQAADGYLWLGTGFGLYRFDGVAFEPVRLSAGQHLLSSNITALAILPGGEIWIGYYFDGVSRLKDGQITHYRKADGVTDGTAVKLEQDTTGTIWLAGEAGLFYFQPDQGGRWRKAGAEAGFTEPHAYWVLCDSHGTLWVADGRSVLYRPAGQTRFLASGAEVTIKSVLAQAPDGTIWASDRLNGTRPIAVYDADSRTPHLLTHALAPGLEKVYVKRLLFRRDGTAWGTDSGQGGVFLARPVHDAQGSRYQVEWFRTADGLTSDQVVPILEDQEDNLWVGTNLGLNRFRRTGVVMLRGIGGFHPGPFALPWPWDHELTIITGGAPLVAGRELLQRVLGGQRADDAAPDQPLPNYYGLAALDAVLASHGVPHPPHDPTDEYLHMSFGASGHDWISRARHGVERLVDGSWRPDPRLPPQDALVIAPEQGAARGSTWFGYAGNLAIELGADGTVRRYTETDGLAIGNTTAIHAQGPTVVIAGERGIAVRIGRRFHMLDRVEGFYGITGIVSAGDSLWLNGSKGIIRVPLESLRRAALDPSHPPDYRLFDAYDGLSGVALQEVALPTAARSADGLLWFSTNQGIAVVDPERIGRNAIPPHVIVRSLLADDVAYPLPGPGTGGAAPRLPSRTGRVELDYTATSLTIPERVRFRYRLEGVDADWQEGGARREAFYTNLGPGHYRFRVIAANNDGVWNEDGASVEFTVLPTFFQTPWFALLCMAAVLLILCWAYLLRTQQLAARVRARLEERHLERERIARELHDTLLQGFQGLILGMHALVSRLQDDEPSKAQMARTIDQAEALLIEGRDSVRGLRQLAQRRGDLGAALQSMRTELAPNLVTGPLAGRVPGLDVTVSGEPRALRPIVHDELYRIGREAILNAHRHGQPARIAVALCFGEDRFRLSVSDDGRGMDLTAARASPLCGHWGLHGMRERAQRIGAALTLHTGTQGGVEVTVVLEARAAYEPRPYPKLPQRLQGLLRLKARAGDLE